MHPATPKPSTESGTLPFKLPVYLEETVESYLTKKAEAKGVELSDLVNDLLKKDIELIEPGG